MSGDPWCDGAGACLFLGLGALLLVSAGWITGAVLAVGLLLGLLAGGLAGLLTLKLWPEPDPATDARWRWSRAGLPHSPEALVRARFARGELPREQYLRVREDLLKDRYVRGEFDLDEYEAQLDALLREPGVRVTRS